MTLALVQIQLDRGYANQNKSIKVVGEFPKINLGLNLAIKEYLYFDVSSSLERYYARHENCVISKLLHWNSG